LFIPVQILDRILCALKSQNARDLLGNEPRLIRLVINKDRVDGVPVVVAELSRLARSVGQIAILVDGLVNEGIRVITIKEGMALKGKRDMKTKVMLTMFSLFAEIERDLVSERTKEGLKRARAEGKLLGRPRGTTSSKLDGREGEIKGYLAKGVNLANVARIYGVSWSTMKHFVASRELA